LNSLKFRFDSVRFIKIRQDNEKFPSRCPSDGCKGTELTDLNSAQSLLEAHN
jgi:hypothetical protein